MNNFSPYMLKTFEQCPMKFFLKYIKKISVPQRSEFFEKGKKIHALASYYLKNQDISRMERALSADEKKAWQCLKSNKYFNLKALNSEYNLTCKTGEWWIGGRLDAFMYDEENRNYFILDYKTGSVPPNAQEDFQTIVYLLCADKLLKNKRAKVNSLGFVYLGLKNNEEKMILLTDALSSRYKEKIEGICSKINFSAEAGMFEKSQSSCSACEYKNICIL